MKKKLNDFANDMQLKSNGIIDSANLLLANPNIPNLQQKYRDTLANAEKSVDDINTPLKEKNIQTGALEPNPKNDLKSAQSLMRSLKVKFNYFFCKS